MSSSFDRRKTFEFRMSKKVAELTQVVHMLFTRNHEKEVEMEALRSAYEEEVDRVMRDARARIAAVERSIEQVNVRAGEETDKVRRQFEAEMQLRQQDMERRFKEAERQVQEERGEAQHLREMLLSSQKGLEAARASLTSEQAVREQEIANRGAELQAQQKRTSQLERSLKEAEVSHNETVRDLENANAKLQKEVLKLQELSEQNRKGREAMAAKNKALEQEIKGLKREVARRMSEISSRAPQMNQSSAIRKASLDAEVLGETTEIDLLRRELLRYKMELSNRDQNFNRVFSEHNPMVVDTRFGKSISSIAPSVSARDQFITNFASQRPTTKSQIQREKTFSYVISQSYDEDPIQVSRGRTIQHHSNEFKRVRLATIQLPEVSKFRQRQPASATVGETEAPSERGITNGEVHGLR